MIPGGAAVGKQRRGKGPRGKRGAKLVRARKAEERKPENWWPRREQGPELRRG